MSAGDDAVGREPNGLLAAARHARRLTQQQLAEAVGAAHWRLFGREVAIDADHVSKLERGLITWPNRRYREAFCAVLGASTDAELGFYYRTRVTVEAARMADRAAEVERVRRNEFIRLGSRLSAAAGLGVAGVRAALPDPVFEVLSLAVTPTVPSRVGKTQVKQVRYATAKFRSWRDRYGGGAFRDALIGQVRWAAGLLGGQAEGTTRKELYLAVGYLADMAGWGEVDAGQHETALSFFRLALYCAEEAGDWSLRAEVLGDMAMQASIRDQFDDALSLIELAQVRVDRVAGTGRAMLSCAHAQILAVAGRASDCQGAVSAAEDHFADRQPVDECVGSCFLRANEVDIALDNGVALFYAGLRDPAAAPAAARYLRAALDHPGTISRRHALGTAKLSTLELLHGDRDEGIALAHRALDLGDGMHSVRLVDDLRQLRTATVRHTGAPVDALRQQLDSVLTFA